MALETATYIADLVTTNPVGATDPISQGDDHLRLIKSTLQATFPNMAGRSWRTQSKGVGYTVLTTDNMTLINCTAAITLSITAAATLGNGHMIVILANGFDVVVDPAGAELINGAATQTVTADSALIMFCTGTTFYGFVLALKEATNAEAIAGTSVVAKMWSPLRIAQAVNALAPPLTQLGLTDGGLKTAGFTAAVRTRYYCVFAADGTITGPASATVGDMLAFGLSDIARTYTFDPNGLKCNGSTSTYPMIGGQFVLMQYNSAAQGWE